ncbi:MAG: THUMP domain-containing protein [Bdellovibrionaceae bacterium]|nr:THUMP domain-containing protein [Pseudobdellovibrionaceae bacterium]
MPRFFAMTSRGLVDVLADELKEIGMERVLKAPGGCFFDSNWAGCYRANLRLRTATRVVLPILDFPAYKPDELYNNIRKHDFTKYIGADATMAVDAVVKDCGLFKDQRFVAMKIKDAVVDQFREKFDVRPDVDAKNPDLQIVVRAMSNRFAVSIDTTGEPMFKRGYRTGVVPAHLKEHVAAGLVKMSEWKKDRTIVDPMCGSGTILIEAALMALEVAPGTLRRRFAFQRLTGFQKAEWERELEAAIAEEKEELPFKFYGYDVDREAIKIARENARKAGVDDVIEFERTAFETLDAPAEKGIMIVNPPFGERLLEKNEAIEVYKNLAFLLKQKFKGWEAYVLSGDPELSKAMKLKATRKFPVYNGTIECRLLKYEMF